MTDTKIKSQNLEAALLFLEHHYPKQYTPDAIKENCSIDRYVDGVAFPPRPPFG